MVRRFAQAVVAVVAGMALVALVGCGASRPASTPTPAAQQPIIVVEQPWVRTTEGTTDPSMSAAFMTLSNPGDADVVLTAAESDVAQVSEIHEMVMVDGKKVMQKMPNGLTIKAGSHQHLISGGHHIMLMKLKKPLAIGDEVAITLTFSTGQKLTVKAPVKKFTEEEEHYHTAAPSAPTTTG